MGSEARVGPGSDCARKRDVVSGMQVTVECLKVPHVGVNYFYS